MLVDYDREQEDWEALLVQGLKMCMRFSLAGEGTKVSMHYLGT